MAARMVDNFSILVSHGLLLFALWRLIGRADLDVENDRWDAAPDSAPLSETKTPGWDARDA